MRSSMFLGRLETVGSCVIHLSCAEEALGASRSEEVCTLLHDSW